MGWWAVPVKPPRLPKKREKPCLKRYRVPLGRGLRSMSLLRRTSHLLPDTEVALKTCDCCKQRKRLGREWEVPESWVSPNSPLAELLARRKEEEALGLPVCKEVKEREREREKE